MFAHPQSGSLGFRGWYVERVQPCGSSVITIVLMACAVTSDGRIHAYESTTVETIDESLGLDSCEF